VRDAARSFGENVMRRRGPIAVVLLLAGVLFGGLYRVADGVEKHSYNSGAVPPQTVRLTQGHQYQISVPGGHKALAKRGISATAVQCSLTPNGGGPVQVTVTPISPDLRPTDALATFESPLSGRVHLDCGPWGAVYVDNADDSGWDYSGLFLVLTVLFLTLGVALGLSALYARSMRDDEQIQRRVGIPGAHHEVGHGDADDVPR
jgi:hypothetical protein